MGNRGKSRLRLVLTGGTCLMDQDEDGNLVLVGRGGERVGEVLPALEKIVRKKGLIVTGPMTANELGSLERLAGQGSLCLRVQLLPDDG